MKLKVIAGLVLTLFLIGILTWAFNIQPVKASETIYIRADGSIYPSTANITSLDNVTYSFTDNNYDEIIVERDNIVVDGAGHVVQGTGSGTGIGLSSRSNVTIKNMEIKAFDFGIHLYYSSNSTIYGNNITNNEWDGILLGLSSNNTIYGNKITANNEDGISLGYSSSNKVYGNDITNNRVGIVPWNSHGDFIYHNNFVNNIDQVNLISYVDVWDSGYPFGGNYWSDYAGVDNYSGPYQNETGSDGIGDTPYVIDANNQDNYPLMRPYRGSVRNLNTGHGYPTIQEAINNASEGDRIFVLSGVYYENVIVNKSISLIGENKYNTVIDGDYTGNTITIMVNNVTVSGFTIRNSDAVENGIFLGNSSHCTIRQNNITDNGNGIFGYGGSFNVFADNFIIGNYMRGIDLGWAGFEVVYNEIKGNIIHGNHYFGIHLFLGRNNVISQNNISNQNVGLQLLGGCRQNVIQKNIFSENDVSIYLWAYANLEWPSNNLIVENTIEVLRVDPGENNVIFHNNFLESNPVTVTNGTNIWDDGYPSGGNCWSDYNGTDAYYGENATGLPPDGIGDTPYFIDANNTDRYPLMGMFSDFNATLEYHVQIICNSSISDFQFNGTAICFDVSGENGTTGFCRICIPTALLNDTYRVFVNSTEVPYILLPCSNSTHIYLYFNYNHSTQEVIIVPEFPAWTSILLMLIVLTVAIAVYKRKLLKMPFH